jgi:thiol-disulfide isomerase/thioredoxin
MEEKGDGTKMSSMKTLRVIGVSLALLGGSLCSLLAADGKREKAAKPERIAHGEKVAITDYVVSGKTTIFDFTSEYCPPCRAIAPKLDQLHKDRDDIVVVKVDINRPNHKGIDWKSPVAQQYELRSVPAFKVYGPDGKLVSEGKEASAKVRDMLKDY